MLRGPTPALPEAQIASAIGIEARRSQENTTRAMSALRAESHRADEMAQLLRDHGMLDGGWIELTVMPGGPPQAFSGPDGGEKHDHFHSHPKAGPIPPENEGPTVATVPERQPDQPSCKLWPELSPPR